MAPCPSAAPGTTLGAEHPDTAIPLIALAACLHAEGRCAEAAPLYRQALELRRPTLDLAEQAEEEEDWGIAVPLSVSLAASLHAQGRYSEAEPVYRQALEMLGRYGEALDNAVVLSGLAACLQAQGRCAEAEPLYQEALELFERIPAKRYMQDWVDLKWFVDRPDRGTVLRSLAACAHAQGRYAEAEPVYRQALELVLQLEQEQGLDDDEGRFAEAEPLYEEALALPWLQLGLGCKPHRDIAMTQTSLAACQESQAGIDNETPLRQALELQRSELGEGHPDTADARAALAACVQAQGRYCEAEPLYRQALDLNRSELGEEHPDTAQSLFDLAVCTEHQGRYSEAAALHRKALELRWRLLGEEHADTNTSRNCLADQHEVWVFGGWEESPWSATCTSWALRGCAATAEWRRS
ncbi:hypothetical protein HYH03_009100 [Edaphochlamys debaryana]|uniref:Kinesin light chain n=1 Tax=Edaphochlamys debaryana TaxID=47281 RepID=A0A836BXF4_9CHLO|nr:hypothetical protein HYH03_009100 [Edaphochlamys debaryana]|eukprot:KAG2492686.1 hypothetical protein HYH03_009100 [Edaphochlamys debaryana]